jgi:hypothetical protein
VEKLFFSHSKVVTGKKQTPKTPAGVMNYYSIIDPAKKSRLRQESKLSPIADLLRHKK